MLELKKIIGGHAVVKFDDDSGYEIGDKYGVILGYNPEKDHEYGDECDFTMKTYKEAVRRALNWAHC